MGRKKISFAVTSLQCRLSTSDIFVISEQSNLIAFHSDMLNRVVHLFLKKINLTVSDYYSLYEGEDIEEIHQLL